MVILDVKGEMEDEFLYECSAKATIEDILSATVSIQNLRYEVRHLSARLRELFFEDSLPGTFLSILLYFLFSLSYSQPRDLSAFRLVVSSSCGFLLGLSLITSESWKRTKVE